MDSEFRVTVTCLFCQAPLTAEEGAEFESGDLIECEACGELNDYDSVIEVAQEKAMEKVSSDLEAELSNTLKNLFK